MSKYQIITLVISASVTTILLSCFAFVMRHHDPTYGPISMISSLSPLKNNPNSQQCTGWADADQVHQSSGDDLLAMKMANRAHCNSANRFMSQNMSDCEKKG